MTDFLPALLTLSGIMSAVILLALIFFRSGMKISSSAVYGIWLIIMIRLAFPIYTMPVLFEFDLPAREVQTAGQSPLYSPQHISEYQNFPADSMTSSFADEQETISYPSPNTAEISETVSYNHETTKSIDLYDIIPAVYLIGVLLSVIFTSASYLSYIHRINRTLALPDDAIMAVYSKAAARLGIKRTPKLYLSSIPTSPMMYGFFSPKIVIPDYLSSSDTEYVLIHELIHYKRRDVWVKLLTYAVRSMHWFNPMVYIAADHLNRSLEMCCDDSVISSLSDSRDKCRIEYSKVMLGVLRRSVEIGNELTSSFEPHKSAVSARFENILDCSKKKRGVIPLLLTVLLCAAAGSIVGCTNTDPSETNPNGLPSEELQTAYTAESESTAEIPYINTALDTMISEIDESTVTVMNSAAYDKRLADGFMPLGIDDVKYIISSSIDLYFRYDNIVLPDILEFFSDYPTVGKDMYLDGEIQTVQIPDTPMTKLYYYLIDGYTISTIHDINDDHAIVESFGYTDINGDGEIDEQEKAQAACYSREACHHEMLYQIRSIIMYRLIALSDPACFSESVISYAYLPADRHKNVFFELYQKGSADTAMTYRNGQEDEILFPTDAISYDNMISTETRLADAYWLDQYFVSQDYENELNAQLEGYLDDLQELKISLAALEEKMEIAEEDAVFYAEALDRAIAASMSDSEEESKAELRNRITHIEKQLDDVKSKLFAIEDNYRLTAHQISYTEQKIAEIQNQLSEIEN